MGSRRGRQQQHPGEGSQAPNPGGRGGRGRGHGGQFPQQAPQPQGGYQQQPRGRAGEDAGRGRARGGTRPQQQHPGDGGRGARGAGPASAAAPLDRLAPELRQAMEASRGPPQASPMLAAGTSEPARAAALAPAEPAERGKQVAVQAEATTGHEAAAPAVPASSKAIRFPLRPGKGSVGTRCLVKANHFIAELPDKDLHQYDVSITPEVTSRVVSRAVIHELVNLHRASYLGGRLPVYDGRKSLYTAGPLPFTSKEFQITLLDDDDGSGSQRSEFSQKYCSPGCMCSVFFFEEKIMCSVFVNCFCFLLLI
jgi:eukaryotic translation initiation factor 2C